MRLNFVGNKMSKSTPSLYILDVGHGNSAVLCDTEGIIVIDAGRGSSLYLFLKQEQITTIDLLLISHADEDHIGGLIGVLASEEFDVKKVRLNSDALKGTKVWDDLVSTLDEMQRSCGIDFEVSLTEDLGGRYNHGLLDIQIVAPSRYLASKSPGSIDRQGRKISSNTMSAVVRLLFDGQAVILFPGDIDMTGLANILENSLDISSPLLIFPHHGGRPGTSHMEEYTKMLCEAVKPDKIIFSTGRKGYENPQQAIVNTIKEMLPEASMLCTQLSKRCATTVRTSYTKHLADAFAHGKEKGHCCAGTIIVSISEDGIQVEPDSECHADFIRKVVDSPLCWA